MDDEADRRGTGRTVAGAVRPDPQGNGYQIRPLREWSLSLRAYRTEGTMKQPVRRTARTRVACSACLADFANAPPISSVAFKVVRQATRAGD